MIPAAFEYVRAHSADEALAHLQQYGSDARVLAGGQSLVPAMRFRLARPAVLVDINPSKSSTTSARDGALTIGATARDIGDRARVLDSRREVEPAPRRLASGRRPVVRQMATVVGSLCHNDPAGDWTAAALAGRAEVMVRGKGGERAVPIDEFLVDSFTTAVEDGELAVAVRFPLAGERTAGSYQKVERKVGDFATAAAAVQVSLDADGTIQQAGIALSAAGPCAMRVAEAESAARRARSRLPTPSAPPPMRRRDAASRRPICAAASSTRSIWPECWSHAVCARLSRVWGCRHEGQHQGQRHRLRARCRTANAARLFPARAVRPHRHARRLRHLELRLLRRRAGRDTRGQVVHACSPCRPTATRC